MKNIDDLVNDVYTYIERGADAPPEAVQELSGRLSQSISGQLRQREASTVLRMSNLGTQCDRKLWYSINKPGDAEPLPAPARLKFLFGHILEDLVLWLAEQSGHKVEGRQDECDISGVKGHRDAVIDGRLVDVKSASTFSFKKFDTNGLVGNDAFGYLTQLGGYLHAAKDDPIVQDKNRASFLAIDKTLGNMCLDTYNFPEYNYHKMIKQKKEILASPIPPKRAFSDLPDGKSGNRKLGVACSYCPFKSKCYPGLRTFAYSTGPVFLTSVNRLPNVPEVTIGKNT